MEALLFLANLIVMLLLLIWSARADAPGTEQTGHGLFDMKPGADCDHRRNR